ncbi:UDP-xylose and UDP-N-acetylglucosamine transporter-like [Babylonia areolata]|uniref:UDP-xylose and UDP-N-acetylglucosamine transporter-like n=1 Tax=Babylonia areolata TaxID=304850 RepID=UPI003FD225D3
MKQTEVVKERESFLETNHTFLGAITAVPQNNNMHAVIAIGFVFLGCCSNVIFLEELIREFPDSGNLITFTAFVFNALEGFIFTSRFLTRRPAIPISYYLTMVGLFFVVQTLNNYVFSLNVSMPLQMIFRSGSLVANLVLGYFLLHKRYKRSKYFAVLLITLGVILCTIASARHVESQPSHTGDPVYDFWIWCLGVFLLVLSLFLSARMGIFQEETYAKFGKHPSEALFYNHLLPLPGFLLLGKDIYNQVLLYNTSAPVMVPVLGRAVPQAWLILAANTVTQYVCIRSVFILTTECASLTVTLVVTLRKFTSLLVSILYFGNAFTPFHWVGTTLVFGGTLLFTEVFSHLARPQEKKGQ